MQGSERGLALKGDAHRGLGCGCASRAKSAAHHPILTNLAQTGLSRDVTQCRRRWVDHAGAEIAKLAFAARF
jgi:hypothetical protein